MWHNQTLFRVSAQLAAEGIFFGLDSTLKPDVFVIGFSHSGNLSQLDVMVEPAFQRFPKNTFDAMAQLIHRFEAYEKESLQTAGHLPEDSHEKFEHLQLLRKNLQVLINESNEDRQLNKVAFCSCPVWVSDLLVFVALQFDRGAYYEHYALASRPQWNNVTAPGSLLDATVAEFLNDCGKALRETEFASGKSILDRDYNELLRSAGKRFMYTPTGTNHGLFDACNAISALKYEGAEGIGSMLLSRRDHPEIYQLLKLDSPVSMRDFRSVRKLLEVAEGNIRLLSDASCVYGFGSLRPGYDFSNADIFTVNFTKHYTWEFVHAGQVMMKVTYGLPSLPKGQLDEQKFRHDLGLTFPEIAEENVQKLWLIIHEITKLRHGTMVVISEGAQQEAARLDKQGFKLFPVPVAPSFIRQLTQIDGALLLDLEGKCHAIGVILDGMASERGDAARGARYNSAIRYIESSDHACLAVVLSEDGLLNVIRMTE